MSFFFDSITNLKKTNSFLFTKFLLLIGFFFINFSIFIVSRVPPSSGYEYSIYDVYPWYFWLFIVLSIYIGQIILLIPVILKSERNNLFGFLLIIISNSVILFLPLIRGYFFYGGQDTFSHIGYMVDIANNFGFGSDHYPADHILGVSISCVSKIPYTDITMFLPQLFSLFSIFSWYLIGKQIFNDQHEFLLFLLFSSMLIFKSVHVTFTPYTQSILLIPNILYLFFKTSGPKNKSVYHILLILYCIIIVFYHPLTALLLILSFFLLQISYEFHHKFVKNSKLKINTYQLSIVLFILFCMWSTYLYKLVNYCLPIINSIIGVEEVGESQFQVYSNLADSVQMSYFDLAKLCFNSYGQYTCLGIISVFCSIYLVFYYKDKLSEMRYYDIVSIIGFVFFSLLTLIVLFAKSAFVFERFFTYSLFFSFLLIPSALYLFFKTSNIYKKFTVIFIVCLILLPTLYFSIFNLYASPKTKLGNFQVTAGDFYGAKRFFDTRNESIPILELGISQLRYYESIYGIGVVRKNIRYGLNLKPVDHFGSDNKSFSSFYNSSYYFLLDSAGKSFYPNIYPEFRQKWRFTPDDFYKLNVDTGISKIYTNNNLEVFIIKGYPKSS